MMPVILLLVASPFIGALAAWLLLRGFGVATSRYDEARDQ